MKIKLSYSTIALWERGEYEAVFEYLTTGKWTMYQDENIRKALEFGRKKHREYEKYVDKHKKIPPDFDINYRLENPVVEEYKTRQILPWLKISGIIDVQYGDKMIDWKTGRGNVSQYTSGVHIWQPRVYKILNPKAKLLDFWHYNQYLDKATMARCFLTDFDYKEAIDKIVTVACDIRATAENMGIVINNF